MILCRNFELKKQQVILLLFDLNNSLYVALRQFMITGGSLGDSKEAVKLAETRGDINDSSAELHALTSCIVLQILTAVNTFIKKETFLLAVFIVVSLRVESARCCMFYSFLVHSR